MDNDNTKQGAVEPASTGSAYWLLKQKGDDLSLHQFDTEQKFRRHVEAMWACTNWHFVAAGISPDGKAELSQEANGTD